MKRHLLQYKGRNAWIILATIIISGTNAFLAMIHMFALDSLLEGEFHTFLTWYARYTIIFICLLLVSYLSAIYKEKTIQKMIGDIRNEITNSIARNSFEQYHKNDPGTYISWLSNDLKIVEQGFNNFYDLLSTFFTVVTSLLALLTLDVYIVLGTLILSIVLIQAPKFLTKYLEKATEKFTEENARFTSLLEDMLKGYETLFFSNRLKFLVNKIKQSNDTLIKETIRLTKTSAKIERIIQFLSLISQMLIFVFTGILVNISRITFGSFLTVGQLAGTALSTLSQFSSLKVAIGATQVIFDKFAGFHTQDKLDYIAPKKQHYDLSMKNISYQTSEKVIFDNFSYNFAYKKKYLLTGGSGSGKSTFFKIISGALPIHKGTIQLGEKIYYTANEKKLNPFVHHAPQDSYLFRETLYENITLGENISHEKIKNILSKLNLGHLSLDMQIDKKNTNLSGGQKQRINIARALVSDAPILLFDEVTANLDEENTKQVEEYILAQDRTILYITHREPSKLSHLFDEHLKLG